MANTLAYPTHALLPKTVRRRRYPQYVNENIPSKNTTGITAAGVNQPWGPIEVGNNLFNNQHIIHAPILYNPLKEYIPTTNSYSPSPSVYSVQWDNTLGCITWNSRNFYLRPFSNGESKTWTLASTEVEENSVARQVVKLTLTFASDAANKGIVTTRLFIYPNSSMLRIQHNFAIPSGDLADLGIQIVEAQLTNAKSNLGTGLSGYNDANGTWDGWVLSNNVFVSIRDAKETYPRGYSIGTTEYTDMSHSLLTGCQSWWEFNEEGNANREDSLGNNTLIYGAGTWSRVTGKVGSSPYGLSPAAANNNMYVADNSSLSITGDMTISVWVKLDSKSHGSTIFSKFDNNQTANRSYYLFYSHTQDKFQFAVYSSTGVSTVATHTLAPTIGEWYHIVCRHNNGSNIKIKVSTGSTPDADVTQTHTSGIQDGGAAFRVGNMSRDGGPDSVAGYWLLGSIDDLTIWNRSLTDGEIATLFAAGQGYAVPITTSTYSGLKIYQHFTNGTRVNATDYSYDNIAKLLYLHQGALNPTLPDEYKNALNTDPEITPEYTEWTGTTTQNYTWNGISSTLEMFVVFCEDANPPDSDLTFYHDIHQEGPIVSHIKVPGMKGQYFSEVETVIKRNILSWVGPWTGQFLYGDWRHNDYSLARVRGQNHYQAVSASWKNFLRTRDSEILKATRRQHRFFRDMCCLVGSGQLGFSHTGSILPWVDVQQQEHHGCVEGLLLAWQVDGDRLSKDKFDMWRPTSWTANKDRDCENTLVQGRILKDYLGEDYSDLAGMKAAREADPTVSVANGADYWNPYWPSREWMAQQITVNRGVAGSLTLYPHILYGTPNVHYDWLSRIAVDYPAAVKPGQIGDMLLAYQWGDFCAECHRQKIHSFPFYYDMGQYPHKTDTYLEVVFTKPTSADLDITLLVSSNGGDVNLTLVRYVKPDNTTVNLSNLTHVTTTAYDNPVNRYTRQKTYTISGPSGQYKLQLNAATLILFGPVTEFPEYCVVQAGSKTRWVEGYFKPLAGGPVQFIQESSTAPIVDSQYAAATYRSWPDAGYFAKYAEWLP